MGNSRRAAKTVRSSPEATLQPSPTTPLLQNHEREVVLRVLSCASFLIFFQAYLVAPLIPALALQFHTSDRNIGFLVPAYLLPYGFFTLFYGPLSDRIGRKPLLLTMIALLALTTAGAASATSLPALLAWRIAAGVASGGIIPISLALLADLFPYHQRGHAIGWIFGAIAGGMAFGSTLGALLNPYLGWRIEFLLISALFLLTLLLAWKHRTLLQGQTSTHPPGLRIILSDYLALLKIPRAQRTYSLIFFNSLFQSGIFSWLGLYFSRRYHLEDRGIGLALLGYGIPGMLLGPRIGRAADTLGRNLIIPAGLLLSALAAAAFAPTIPLLVAALLATALSLGYDMSHPPLTGIITSLDPHRRGQALGLNAFFLFTGFGLGSLLFQLLLTPSLTTALLTFAALELAISLLSLHLLKNETPAKSQAH